MQLMLVAADDSDKQNLASTGAIAATVLTLPARADLSDQTQLF